MTKSTSRRFVLSCMALALAVNPLAASHSARSQAPASPSRTDAYAYSRLKGRQITIFAQWVAEQNKAASTNVHPATSYGALDQTQRSTYEAITHALSRSRLTDSNGGIIKPNGLELVQNLDEIAGQIKGVGGDKQFRIYVRLVPDAQDVLAKSTEFFRDKDNTVFHKEYPINYRQRGKVPTLQFSISKDGIHADIDVDYRSSKPPQALVNGHLKAANSDVRIGGNYLGHIRRWFGLIRWWKILVESDVETASAPSQPSTSQPAQRSALPPSAPRAQLGAEHVAAAQEVSKAMNEFLTMWLLRRNRQRADDFLVKRPIVCANIDDDTQNETVTGQIAIREFALLLDAGLRAKTKPRSLDDAVAALEAWDPELALVDHPYKQLFSLHGVQRDEAQEYICESGRLSGNPDAYGEFFMTVFTLKLAKESGGGLELLWVKEDGQWQIISYDVLEP